MQCVYPSCWVKLQRETQRHIFQMTSSLIQGLGKVFIKELHLERVHRKRMKEGFVCPNHFHHAFPTGQNAPDWVLTPSNSGPLVSERPELMPWDTMLYPSQKRRVTWYGWGNE